MHFEVLELSILGPAFLAGVLVLSTHVLLGREVLQRGIIFIDLAIAQTAGLGVIAAGSLGWDVHGFAAQLAAVSAAVIAGLMLTWSEKRFPDVQEALIGALFILAATGGILLMANNPRAGDELKELLVGQILWVDMHTLWPAAMVSAVVVVAWFGLREKLGTVGFYLLFALSVTVSVQLVGVYLVFASLIIPALATRHVTGRKALPAAYAMGVAGFGLGLVLSALLDLPSGPMIVWSLAVLAVMMGALSHAKHSS